MHLIPYITFFRSLTFSNMLLTLPSLSLLAFACVPAVALSDTRPPNGLSHARRQSVTGQNPFDHSWITEWAALGDSFASGPGAGKRSNWWCSRYDGAYGNLINNDQSLGVNPNRNFHYLACLGQTTSEILRDQVNSLSNQQMMITMSAGGNDVGFGDLVDACIYQYEKRNWECDPQLEKTKKAILGDEFSQNLDKLMQATVKKLAYPNSRVFWTAYSKFFDTTTKDCDSVTWATILAIGRREFLTVARRQQFNDLVDLINGKLKDAAKRAGNQVVIVEWEDKIDTITGRYCEPGVDETAGKGDDRESLAYYEWYSTLDDKVYRNGVSDSMVKSIPQIDTNQSAATAPADQMGPYQANIIRNISESIKADPTLIPNFQALNTELHGINDPVQIASILSDKILRNFHPQSNAHQRIAAAVLTALEQDQAHDINQPSATTTAIGCTAPTGISSLPGVRDHCYRDKPVDHQIKFRADNAEIAIATFCNSHAGQLVTGGDGIKESRPNDDSDTTALVLRVSRRSDGDCKPGDHEPEIHLSDFECIAYMRNALHMCKSPPHCSSSRPYDR
jgi:hypothetical protein